VNVRPASEDDLAAVTAFLADDEERQLGRASRIGTSDLRAWLGTADLGRDTWLYEDDELGIAGFGWVEAHAGFAVGVVHEEAKGHGLGSDLAERAETRLRDAGLRQIHEVAFAADRRAAELFGARGYREARRFWEMGIELDGLPPEPSLPAGLRLETFTPAAARPFHDALEEAFRDHWEHRPRPFEEWWAEKQAAPDLDVDLWFLVRDGDEVAAAVRNDPNRNGGGWVAALGVRRPWRGRGVGRALLLHTFREFHRRGVTRVSLGVDAESPTGATRLYESVGMTVELEQVVYEKALA
jgi:mycothiol synthase